MATVTLDVDELDGAIGMLAGMPVEYRAAWLAEHAVLPAPPPGGQVTLYQADLFEMLGKYALPKEGDCAPVAEELIYWVADHAIEQPKPWDPIADSKFKRELSAASLAYADSGEDWWDDQRVAVVDPDRANLIGSRLVDQPNERRTGTLHAPVIDIDLECHLLPSTTPGHFHLYIEKAVSWEAYGEMLTAMCDAGIVEPGYVDAALHRGMSHVRKPGVMKQKDDVPEWHDEPDDLVGDEGCI